MKRIGIIIIILALISCTKGNDQYQAREGASTKYFSKLAGIISPYLEYQGRGKISEEEAAGMKHYRFNFNEDGRLLDIQYFDKGQPDEKSYYGTHCVKYGYIDDHQIIRSYYDINGKKASAVRHYYFGNNIHREIFELDKNQDKTTLILMDSAGNQIESGLGSYSFQFQRIDDHNFIQTQFKKDGSPNILTNYFPFYKTKISTHDNGFLHMISNVNEQGEMVTSRNAGYAYVIFDFDKYGNEFGWSFHDVSQSLSNRKNYFDLDYGFAKVEYHFNWKNKELGLHYGFEEIYIDERNQPTENDKGVHLIRYNYDQNGNFVKMVKYNLEGIEVG